MDKPQIIEQMAENYSLSKSASTFMVDLFLKEAAQALIQEGKLELGDFGTFLVTGSESYMSDRKTTTENKVIFDAGSMFYPVNDHATDALTTGQLKSLLDGL